MYQAPINSFLFQSKSGNRSAQYATCQSTIFTSTTRFSSKTHYFSCLGALCFPSGDAFLLVHPTSLLLLTLCQTRGFFCSEKYFLCFHVPKLIGINCFWPQINFSPFFSANYPWSQIIVHIFEEVPFCDSSVSVLFNIPRKLDLPQAPQNVNPLCWRQYWDCS